MISKEIEIRAPHGLHLRVAAKIVQANKDSKTKVIFIKGWANSRCFFDLGTFAFRCRRKFKDPSHCRWRE